MRLPLALVAACLVGSAAAIVCDTEASTRQAIREKAKALLELSDDFYIIEGNMTFNSRIQIGNPAGKYGTVRLPEQAHPPVFCEKIQPPNATWVASFCSFTYTMGPRDAIVWLGCTPPPAKYFSVRTNTAFRFRPSPWFAAAPLGDPNNQLTMNTTGGSNKDPFQKTALVISTGDGETEGHVRKAFVQAGMPEEAINLDLVPADLAYFRDFHKPWAVDMSDAFAWQFRVTEVEDRELGAEYFQKVWPVYYLRAKRHYNDGPRDPLYQAPPRHRGTGETQEKYVGPLKDLQDKVTATLGQHLNADLTHRFPLEHVVPNITRCLSDPNYNPVFITIPAWGIPGMPSCDWFVTALYSLPPTTTDFPSMYFPTNRIYVVLGVNQEKVKRCNFGNLLLSSVANFEQEGHTANLTAVDLEGSAAVVAPGLNGVDDLYSLAFSRDCEALKGVMPCREVPLAAINETEWVYWVERKYLEVPTKSGPSPEEVIPPLILAYDMPLTAVA